MNIIGDFLNSYFLWRDPLLISALCGAICGITGVYVVLKRVVFLSAALTQVASLGVATAFYPQMVATGSLLALSNPFYFAVIITCGTAIFFSADKEFFPVTLEGIIGFTFLAAGALTVIISDRLTHGQHEIENVLFGSAVVVDRTDTILIPTIVLFTLILHRLFYKDFVFVSFDPETAKLFGYPVRIINAILFIILGTVIATTSRALGAMPVFALLVFPSLSSLCLTENLRYVFVLSLVIGTTTSVIGYFLSFVLSIPTGASIVLTGSMLFLASFVYYKI